MQFDDPKSILERAAAKPSGPVDVVAMIQRGKQLRRLRAGAAMIGLAVVVAGASASLGLRGDSRGPGVAAAPSCDYERHATVFLRFGVAEADVSALHEQLSSVSGVVSVVRVSGEVMTEQAVPAYGEEVDLQPVPAGYFKLEVVDGEALDRVEKIENEAIEMVVPGPGLDPACIAELCENPPPPSTSIFLHDHASRKDALVLRDLLRDTEDIEGVEYVSRKEAYEEFQNLYEPPLYETMSRSDLPRSLRVRAATQEAVERLHELRLRIVDEVRSHGGACAELGELSPLKPAYEELTLPDQAPRPGDDRKSQEIETPVPGPDVDASLRSAECSLDPPSSIEGEPDPSVKWCSFEVSIENGGPQPFHLDWDARLQLVRDGEAPTLSTAMFTGGLTPRMADLWIRSGKTVIEELHFEVDAAEIPIELLIPYEGGRLTFELDYDCTKDLRDEAYGRCEFGERSPEG